MLINQGNIIEGNYVKRVEFSKAVLWKDRQISLNPTIVTRLKEVNVKEIWFEDYKKNERWMIELQEFLEKSFLKQVGQEEQYYIPINLFRKEKIIKDPIQPSEKIEKVETMKLL